MNILYSLKNKSLVGITIIIFLLMAALPQTLNSQVKVAFDQPTIPTIYSIKGDFTMIGNTNMTLQSYSDDGSNSNNPMVYVDVDGDVNTLNSSSANLTFSTENGAIPANSTILYAGLYWTGRAHNGPSPDTFDVTKNGVTKSYDKSVVYLKHASAGGYTTIYANDVNFTQDIYYPPTSYPYTDDGYMYSAYADVTSYVKQYGLGTYFVADMALNEGTSDATGYYGGWGMIVVYSNPLMNWRDVTIFDGHAYVAGGVSAYYDLTVTGFNTAQSGQVNMKLGMMAGEGDRPILGDNFAIQIYNTTNYQVLSHGGNSADNFFNSSIFTGENPRDPSLVNNTGLDIAMFNIPNNNNSVIANNQTSTTFRYGSTQDTYIIFCIAMSVDCTPQLSITKTVTEASYSKVGDLLHYEIAVANTGNVTLSNVLVTDPLTGLSQNIASLLPGAPNEVTINTTYTITQADLDAGKVANTVKAAYLYGGESHEATASKDVPATKATELKITKIVAETSYNEVGNILHYTIVITNTGNIALTNVVVTDPLTMLNQTIANLTTGTANAVTINTAYTVTQADLVAGKVDNTAHAAYIYGDKAYDLTASLSVPVQQGSEFLMPPNTSEIVECIDDIVVPKPPVVKDVYGNEIIPVAGESPVVPLCQGDIIYSWIFTDKTGKSYIWNHTITIKYKPLAPIAPTFGTIACVRDIWDGIVPALPVVTDNCGNVLTPTGPVRSSKPKCEGTKTWTWTYTDCAGNTQKYVHTVEIKNLPLAPILPTSSTFECVNSFRSPEPPLVTDNCGNILTPTGPVKTNLPLCEGSKTWTWTYTDCSGNKQDYVHTMYFKHATSPAEVGTPAATSSLVACADEAVAPALPVVKDVCGNILTPVEPVIGGTFDGCEGTRSYTYTYTDCAGLKIEWTYTYTIKDKTSPEIVLNNDKSEYTIEGCDFDFRLPMPKVNDNCDSNVTLSAFVDGVSISTSDLASYKFEKEGSTKVTFIAADDCSNSNTFVVTVNRESCPVGKSEDFSDVTLAVYPNPFGRIVKFEIKLLFDTHVRIDIFTHAGTLIGVILDADLNQGDVRTVEFDATAYPHSAFLYRVTTDATMLNGIILKTK